MFHASPYQLFSPIHLAWLYRCHERKLDVTAADWTQLKRASLVPAAMPCLPIIGGAPMPGNFTAGAAGNR
jgi:hypothetical protein